MPGVTSLTWRQRSDVILTSPRRAVPCGAEGSAGRGPRAPRRPGWSSAAGQTMLMDEAPSSVLAWHLRQELGRKAEAELFRVRRRWCQGPGQLLQRSLKTFHVPSFKTTFFLAVLPGKAILIDAFVTAS